MTRLYLTLREAAKATGYSIHALRQIAARPGVQSKRVGTMILVHVGDVTRYAQKARGPRGPYRKETRRE